MTMRLSNPTDRLQRGGGLVQVSAAGAIALTPLAGQAVTVTGSLVMATAASKLIPGATSLSHRNNADSADNLLITDAGLVTVRAGLTLTAGSLTLGAAASRVVPGATSLAFRNNADSLTHLGITDVGQVTIFPETAPTGFPGTNIGVQVGTTANTYTTPQGAGTVLLRIDGNFKNTVDGTGYVRALSTEVHWTDTLLGASTFAGGYFNVYHDTASPVDIQDIIGIIGRVFFTSTGVSSIGAWGVRGDLNFSAAATVTRAANIISHQGNWSGSPVIATYSGLEHRAHDFATGVTITDAYGLLVEKAVGNASGNTISAMLGNRFTWTGQAALFANGGSLFKGNPTLPPPTDTSSAVATIALAGGDNAGTNTNLVALYFYRNQANLGYIGFDSDVASVMAGHTKALTDLVLKGGKLVVDPAGQIWSNQQIGAQKILIQPTVLATGSPGVSFLYTGAAHTGLTLGSINEFNWNANSVMTFATSGAGGTAATAHTYQFQRRQYASDVSTTITLGTTLRVTGAPISSSNIVFGSAWAVFVDSGSSFFGGAIIQGHTTAAINSTNTATAAQVATGYITSTSAALTTITLPTGTLLGAALGAVQGTIHDLYIDNTAGANTVTVAVNTNAIQSAMGGTLTVPAGVTGQACFRLMFSSATAYTFTRIA